MIKSRSEPPLRCVRICSYALLLVTTYVAISPESAGASRTSDKYEALWDIAMGTVEIVPGRVRRVHVTHVEASDTGTVETVRLEFEGGSLAVYTTPNRDKLAFSAILRSTRLLAQFTYKRENAGATELTILPGGLRATLSRAHVSESAEIGGPIIVEGRSLSLRNRETLRTSAAGATGNLALSGQTIRLKGASIRLGPDSTPLKADLTPLKGTSLSIRAGNGQTIIRGELKAKNIEIAIPTTQRFRIGGQSIEVSKGQLRGVQLNVIDGAATAVIDELRGVTPKIQLIAEPNRRVLDSDLIIIRGLAVTQTYGQGKVALQPHFFKGMAAFPNHVALVDLINDDSADPSSLVPTGTPALPYITIGALKNLHAATAAAEDDRASTHVIYVRTTLGNLVNRVDYERVRRYDRGGYLPSDTEILVTTVVGAGLGGIAGALGGFEMGPYLGAMISPKYAMGRWVVAYGYDQISASLLPIPSKVAGQVWEDAVGEAFWGGSELVLARQELFGSQRFDLPLPSIRRTISAVPCASEACLRPLSRETAIYDGTTLNFSDRIVQGNADSIRRNEAIVSKPLKRLSAPSGGTPIRLNDSRIQERSLLRSDISRWAAFHQREMVHVEGETQRIESARTSKLTALRNENVAKRQQASNELNRKIQWNQQMMNQLGPGSGGSGMQGSYSFTAGAGPGGLYIGPSFSNGTTVGVPSNQPIPDGCFHSNYNDPNSIGNCFVHMSGR